MSRSVVKYLFMYIVIVAIQVLFLNQVEFNGYINPFLYIIFIMLLPIDSPRYVVLLSGFILGLTIDVFSNTFGVHAAASVLIAFLRPYIIRSISRRDDDRNFYPGLKQYGFRWFLVYTIFMVLFHHTLFFFLEIYSFTDFFLTISRILLSSISSVIIIVLSQFIFFRN